MTDQPTPEGTPQPDAASPSSEPPPLAPLVAAAATPPPMPAAAPMTAAVPPPAVAWQAAPPAAPVKGQRTTLAMVAGILLLLLAIGGGLLGLLVVVLGSAFVSSLGDIGNIPGYNGDPAAIVGGVVAFFGLVIVAYSVAYLLAGIGVLRNSNWARVLGIVVGIISGLIWLSGVSSSNGAVFSIIMLAIHAYIVVALLFYWRTKVTA